MELEETQRKHHDRTRPPVHISVHRRSWQTHESKVLRRSEKSVALRQYVVGYFAYSRRIPCSPSKLINQAPAEANGSDVWPSPPQLVSPDEDKRSVRE